MKMINEKKQAKLITLVESLWSNGRCSPADAPNEKIKAKIASLLSSVQPDEFDLSKKINQAPLSWWLVQAALQCENSSDSNELCIKRILNFNVDWNVRGPGGQTLFYALLDAVAFPYKLQDIAWRNLYQENRVTSGEILYKIIKSTQINWAELSSEKPSLLSLLLCAYQKIVDNNDHNNLNYYRFILQNVFENCAAGFNIIEAGFGINGVTPLLRFIKLIHKPQYALCRELLPKIIENETLQWCTFSSSHKYLSSPFTCLIDAASAKRDNNVAKDALERILEIHSISNLMPNWRSDDLGAARRCIKELDLWLSINEARDILDPVSQVIHLKQTAQLAEQTFNNGYSKSFFLMINFYCDQIIKDRKDDYDNKRELIEKNLKACQYYIERIPTTNSFYHAAHLAVAKALNSIVGVHIKKAEFENEEILKYRKENNQLYRAQLLTSLEYALKANTPEGKALVRKLEYQYVQPDHVVNKNEDIEGLEGNHKTIILALNRLRDQKKQAKLREKISGLSLEACQPSTPIKLSPLN